MKKPKLNVDSIGTKRWYVNHKLHREDGPAIEYANGNKSWYVHDELHRTTGPAVEFANGTNRWWLYGHQYSFDRYAIAAKWTDEQIVEWKLTNEHT
jgi:hypothetical protein